MAIFFLSFSCRPSVNGLTFVFFLSTPPCLLYILDSTTVPGVVAQFTRRVETHYSDKSGAISTSISILHTRSKNLFIFKTLSQSLQKHPVPSTASPTRPPAHHKATNQAKPANHCLSFAVVQSSGLLDRPGLEASIAYLV
ncbi:hypothetical protein BGZ61DRAFT_54422 [Ilyonectria robusta]|uniref:uncharacterized protein n=1 Tax=Ilyonectria robusta TaxID=1079257 RepID=UPI001E8D359F|nr:uncharacterized protein BGZ61DRAFT_54422 [Ilyonectria robusta]KAH8686613.1 hypothetical protein BGZ61DRAFT_54422 [Ilyonectria robusta]